MYVCLFNDNTSDNALMNHKCKISLFSFLEILHLPCTYLIVYLFTKSYCSECLDPFDEPECEALDLFINEVLCVGKGTQFLHSLLLI